MAVCVCAMTDCTVATGNETKIEFFDAIIITLCFQQQMKGKKQK